MEKAYFIAFSNQRCGDVKTVKEQETLIMMKTQKQQKITWNDIKDSGIECAKYYNLDQRETERQVRAHLNGANAKERRELYQEFYGKRK